MPVNKENLDRSTATMLEQKRTEQWLAIRNSWMAGESSTPEFLPQLISEIIRSGHTVRMVNINQLKPEDILNLLQNSPSINTAFIQGLNGYNPEKDFFRFYSYLEGYPFIAKRNRLTNVDIAFGELNSTLIKNIDANLPQSILGHLFFTKWIPQLYSKFQEKIGIDLFSRPVFKALSDKKEASVIIYWLMTKRIIHMADIFSVESIMALANKKTVLDFPSLEAFAGRISTAYYFQGWGERLSKTSYKYENSLPKYLNEVEAKQVLLSALFLRSTKQKQQVMTNVLTRLAENDLIGAKKTLAEVCALAKIHRSANSPLRSWEIEFLELEGMINEAVAIFYQNLSRDNSRKRQEKIEERKRKTGIKHTEQEKNISALSKSLIDYLINNSFIKPDAGSDFNLYLKPTELNLASDANERIVFTFLNGILVHEVNRNKNYTVVFRYVSQNSSRRRKDEFTIRNAEALFNTIINPQPNDRINWNIDRTEPQKS